VRQEEPSITVAWMRALLRFVSGSARDLTPIVLVIALFQLLVLRQPLPDLGSALVGLGLVLLGLALFVRGLDLGLFPLGESMAHAFARKGSLVWLLAFSFSLGFGTTVAEPALLAMTPTTPASAMPSASG
jgi:Na+/phosphate symporter